METCPKTIVFEANEDAYPCDFLIHKNYRLGNIRESYKKVNQYAYGRMTKLANKIKKEKLLELIQKGHRPPARNDMCICGSRKKYKKCCGTLLDAVN